MLILTNLNLNKNELQNVRLQNLATNPSAPLEGQVYFNTVDNKFYGWNGTTWVDLGAAGGAGTGDYNDLINKPTIPSKTSDLTNDSNYVTTTITDGLSTEIQGIKNALDDDADGSILDTIANLKAQWESADGSLTTLINQKSSKFTQVIGDGSATQISVTHNLNTLDVIVGVRSNQAPYDVVYADITISNSNTISVAFAQAPTSNQYKIIVIG